MYCNSHHLKKMKKALFKFEKKKIQIFFFSRMTLPISDFSLVIEYTIHSAAARLNRPKIFNVTLNFLKLNM